MNKPGTKYKHKLIINKGKNPITNAKIIQDCNWAAKASTKCVKIKEHIAVEQAKREAMQKKKSKECHGYTC